MPGPLLPSTSPHTLPPRAYHLSTISRLGISLLIGAVLAYLVFSLTSNLSAQQLHENPYSWSPLLHSLVSASPVYRWLRPFLHEERAADTGSDGALQEVPIPSKPLLECVGEIPSEYQAACRGDPIFCQTVCLRITKWVNYHHNQNNNNNNNNGNPFHNGTHNPPQDLIEALDRLEEGQDIKPPVHPNMCRGGPPQQYQRDLLQATTVEASSDGDSQPRVIAPDPQPLIVPASLRHQWAVHSQRGIASWCKNAYSTRQDTPLKWASVSTVCRNARELLPANLQLAAHRENAALNQQTQGQGFSNQRERVLNQLISENNIRNEPYVTRANFLWQCHRICISGNPNRASVAYDVPDARACDATCSALAYTDPSWMLLHLNRESALAYATNQFGPQRDPSRSQYDYYNYHYYGRMHQDGAGDYVANDVANMGPFGASSIEEREKMERERQRDLELMKDWGGFLEESAETFSRKHCVPLVMQFVYGDLCNRAVELLCNADWF